MADSAFRVTTTSVVRRRGCRRLPRRRELRARRLLRRRARPRHVLYAELGRRLFGAGPGDDDGRRAITAARSRMPVTERLEPARQRAISAAQTWASRPARTNSTSPIELTDNWSVSTGVRVRRAPRRLADRAADAGAGRAHGRGRASRLRLEGPRGARTASCRTRCRVDGDREENGRVGTGGSYRLTERFKIDAEVSNGDLGAGGKVGTNYLHTERTTLYLNYALENERTDNGLLATRGSEGNTVAGVEDAALGQHQRVSRGALSEQRALDRSHARDGHQLGADGALESRREHRHRHAARLVDGRRDRSPGGRLPRRLRVQTRCSSRAASSIAPTRPSNPISRSTRARRGCSGTTSSGS